MGLLGKASPRRFARKMIRALRRAGVGEPIRYNQKNFAIVLPENGRLYLHNAYEEYRKAKPWHRRRVIEQFVRVGREGQDELPGFEEAKAHLLPRVRDRFFHEATRLQDEVEGQQFPEIPHRRLATHLTVEVTYDQPHSVRSIGRQDLDEWGLSFEQALSRARENLWQISNEDFVEESPGVFASPWEDSHDAARLFLHDLVWQLDVRGAHVAAVPNCGVLIVTGDRDERGLARLAELTQQVLEQDSRPMTGIPVRLENHAWEPFHPPPGHPAYAAFRYLYLLSQQKNYDQQQALLDAWCQKAGEDVHVAGYNLAVDEETDEIFSYSTWASGVEALLPRVNRIALGRREEKEASGFRLIGMVEWERLAEVAGHRLRQKDGLYPARFRVAGFPSKEELRAVLPNSQEAPDER